MDEFNIKLKVLLLSYEGYFSFGSYDGVVIDGKTTFLTTLYDFQDDYDFLEWASSNCHLEIVKRLVKNRTNYAGALRQAAGYGHLDVVKYLVEHGGRRRTSGPSSYRAQASVGTRGLSEATEASDVHAENDEALREALWYRHLDDVVDYLKNPKSYSRKYQIYKYLSR